MPILTNPETGEEMEISLEEMAKMMRSGQGSIQQVVKHADGSTTSSALYGNVFDDGIDRSVNIFASTSDINYPAIMAARKIKEVNPDAVDIFVMDNSDSGYEITVDDTEQPIMHVMKCTKETVKISRYIRDERKTVGDPIAETVINFVDGKIEGSIEEIQSNKLTLFIFGIYQTREILKERGLLQELQSLANRGSGVIVTTDEEGVHTRLVRGRNRPDLPCHVFLLGKQMMRPYMDEMFSDTLMAGMSPEELIAAAEDGDPDIMEHLAQAYLNGDDEFEQDFEKSTYWWEKLASTGNAIGQFNTGLHYAKGAGVERDFAKAAEWMKLAAENGDEDAPDVAALYAGAAEMLKKAEAGDADAQAEAATFYMRIGGSLYQYGSDDDYAESFAWAQKSADKGSLEGMYCLALCYEHGRGTLANAKLAADTYEKAAKAGHAPSQWNYAVCYFNGVGRDTDWITAYTWAYQSADQGYELAINGLSLQDKTIDQVIETYKHAQREIKLERTQYDGRADRCENLRSGTRLRYKFTEENNREVLEIFHNNASVGVLHVEPFSEVIALLRLDRIELDISVLKCIPKSERGNRARSADVDLLFEITEKKPETPEELANRLAKEEAQRKAEEERMRREAEAKRKAEEERKQAEKLRKEKEAAEKAEAERIAKQKASEKMLEAVSTAKAKAANAERLFDRRADNIESLASSNIDLFGDLAVSQVVNIAKQSKQACDDLYASYQTLIKILDDQCRPLLDREPDFLAVRAVRDLIIWLNDESEIENNFTATLNDYDLGELACAWYTPTIENKMIQTFWETKYDMWPGRAEAEQRERELEEERKRREAEAKRKAEEERKQAEQLRKEKESAEKAEAERIAKQKAKELQDAAAKMRSRYITASGMIACSGAHVVAVKPDGTVVATGDNYFGQCNVSGWRDVIAVACESGATVGLTSHGTVLYTGSGLHRERQCMSWTGIKEIAIATGVVFGLKHDGTVVATSETKSGASYSTKPDVTTWRNIVAIRTGGVENVLGIKSDGNIVAIGRNYLGRCVEEYYLDGKTNVQDAAYGFSGGVVLHKNGKCTSVGSNVFNPTKINTHSGIVKVDMLSGRPIAILADGTLVIEPGDKRLDDFIKRNNIKKVAAVSCGALFVVLTADGRVFVKCDSVLCPINDEECFGKNFRLFDGFNKMMDNREAKAERIKKEKEEQERRRKEEEQRRAERRQKGLCQHCGGKFEKVLFGMKCSSCGTKKDYKMP